MRQCWMSLFATIAFAEAAVATPRIDQEQPGIELTVGGLALGGPSAQKLAQVLTAGLSGALEEVRFPVACSSGDLRIEIQGVTDGEPSGFLLTSELIPGASLSGPGSSFRSLVLSPPVAVTAGSRLAIVLSTDGSCGVFRGPAGDPYSGGDGFYDSRPNQPGWLRLTERLDLPFQTIVDAQAFRSIRGSASLKLGPGELDDSFVAGFVFEPSGSSELIDPVAQDLRLQVGDFSRIIGAGSFVEDENGLYRFAGTVGGVRLRATLRILRRGRFFLRVKGSGANLTGSRLPLELGLSIGDENGRVTLSTSRLTATSDHGVSVRGVRF